MSQIFQERKSFIAILFSVFCLFFITGCGLSPESVAKKIDAADSVKEVKSYCTNQGYNLLLWSEKKSKENNLGKNVIDHEFIETKYDDKAKAKVYFKGNRDGEVFATGFYYMTYSDSWKFHDIYFDTIEGEKRGLWGTEIKENSSSFIGQVQLFFNSMF